MQCARTGGLPIIRTAGARSRPKAPRLLVAANAERRRPPASGHPETENEKFARYHSTQPLRYCQALASWRLSQLLPVVVNQLADQGCAAAHHRIVATILLWSCGGTAP